MSIETQITTLISYITNTIECCDQAGTAKQREQTLIYLMNIIEGGIILIKRANENYSGNRKIMFHADLLQSKIRDAHSLIRRLKLAG